MKDPNLIAHLLVASGTAYQPNTQPPHIREGNTQFEFLSVERWCRGLGFDIGCGTNRFSASVLSTDCYPHKDADLVWNCLKQPFPFSENVFDFVFSSHVIEDFAPDEIQGVFNEWMRIVKPGGYLVLLVPDIQNHRYPYIDEVFTEEDDEVKTKQRRAGELKGNPSHRITMGMDVLNSILASYNSTHGSKATVVQADTLPHDQMTLDFVVQK